MKTWNENMKTWNENYAIKKLGNLVGGSCVFTGSGNELTAPTIYGRDYQGASCKKQMHEDIKHINFHNLSIIPIFFFLQLFMINIWV